jgi:Raf kinase inhibitor-like YbhB/YbcL family protein
MASRSLLSAAITLAALFAVACQTPKNAESAKPKTEPAAQPAPASGGGEMSASLKLTSSAFDKDGEIPSKYTCEGEDVSVPLTWEGLPEGTKSLALIVDDPDAPDPQAPKMTWVHWVVYNIPPDATGLAEALKQLPAGAKDGLNDWKRTGYGGPCPPIGRHRYFHKLHALDTVLPDLGNPTKDELLEAMKGHVLAQTELVGTYQKQK